MNSVTTFATASSSLNNTLRAAGILGRKLRGGEVIELVGDLGAGKTAFVRGLAKGINSHTLVQSPSFTIARIYKGKKLTIHHFDFHRLAEPGVIKHELAESLNQPNTVTVIEWSGIVKDALPEERLQIKITATGNDSRQIEFSVNGKQYESLLEGLKNDIGN